MSKKFRNTRRRNVYRPTRASQGVIALPAKTTGFTKMNEVANSFTQSAWGDVDYGTSWYDDNYLEDYTAVYPMDKNLLFRILSVQSETGKTLRMEQFIVNTVRKWQADGMDITCAYDTVMGNIYVTKGQADVYPTLVAHTDTVHDIVPNSEYAVRSNGKYMYAENPKTGAPEGIGGDDKVGIFIALTMLRDLPVCKAAFFVDEEVGCLGSAKADMDFFKNSTMVLQCDRRGNNDFVYSIMGRVLYGLDFTNAIKPILAQFNYREAFGGMTDVWKLKVKGLNVVCANMSCGYFAPHSSYETVGLLDVQRCLDLVRTTFEQLGATVWPFVYTPPVYTPRTYSYKQVNADGTVETRTVTQPYGYDADEDDDEWDRLNATVYGLTSRGWFQDGKLIDDPKVSILPQYTNQTTSQQDWEAVQRALLDEDAQRHRRVSDIINARDDEAELISTLLEKQGPPSCSTCGTEGYVYFDDVSNDWFCANCQNVIMDDWGKAAIRLNA